MTEHYSMIIEWSDEDQCFVVLLPDFGPYAKTHGDSYQDAAKAGEEVLNQLIQTYLAESRPLPEARALAVAIQHD